MADRARVAEQVRIRQRRRYGPIGYRLRMAASYLRWRLRGKGHEGAMARCPLTIEVEWVSRRTAAAGVHEPRTGQFAGGASPLDR